MLLLLGIYRSNTILISDIVTHCTVNKSLYNYFKGGVFSRGFINFELGPSEVAPCMPRTFGEVSGHRRPTGSEPHPT